MVVGKIKQILIAALIASFVFAGTGLKAAAGTVRLKDISHFNGVRENQIIGYGVVVGLPGSGDNSKSTQMSNVSMLKNLGTVIDKADDIKKGNTAAVIVTATIPAFVRSGDKIDVTVSSLADAKSLEGGVLVQTQLLAPNGEVIAVAQGPLSTGGSDVSANGSSSRSGITTSGRIPSGAIVERDVISEIGDDYGLKLVLNKADFTMAARVASVIDSCVSPAKAIDGSTIQISLPEKYMDDKVKFISIIENLTLAAADAVAKVVVNERTGTIVIGSNVKLLPAAIAHGTLTVTVNTTNEVSQPSALSSGGTTQAVSNSKISIDKQPGRVIEIPSNSNLSDLVKALNSIGVTPYDLISILQALKEAGSLQATLEII